MDVFKPEFIILEYPASTPNENAQIPNLPTISPSEVQPALLGESVISKGKIYL